MDYLPSGGLTLVQRLRRWTNIDPSLGIQPLIRVNPLRLLCIITRVGPGGGGGGGLGLLDPWLVLAFNTPDHAQLYNSDVYSTHT